jgi:guanine nucleotide exchange factor VAV
VLLTLSKLSRSSVAQRSGIAPFSVTEPEQEYASLHGEPAAVRSPGEEEFDDAADDEIYHSVIHRSTSRTSAKSASVLLEPKTKREHCIKEILDTESNYVEALDTITNKFVNELRTYIPFEDRTIIFYKIPELFDLHSKILRQMMDKTQQVMMSSSRTSRPAVCRLYQVFIDAKIDLLVYGEYCSNLPLAQSRADKIATSALYRTHIERAEKTYNEGKFKLRELLTIPLQRVLKYHLLLRELKKQTESVNKKAKEAVANGDPSGCSTLVPDEELEGIDRAMRDMEDLSGYINEMKRDLETRKTIEEIQTTYVLFALLQHSIIWNCLD